MASGEGARSAVPRPPPSVRVPNERLDRFLSAVGEVILTSTQLRTAAGSGAQGARSAGPAGADRAGPAGADRAGPAGTDRARLAGAGAGPGEAALARGFDHMDRVVSELKRRALDLRTTPLLRIMENLPRLAREVAARDEKRIEVELRGAELELDRSILDRLYDPLVHLVRNAVDHGLERPEQRLAAGKAEVGRLVIEATREKDAIRISVRDDGAGVDLDAVRARAVAEELVHPDLAEDLPASELLEMVFRPGLSTAERVTDLSGRGVGMDAVRATLESLGGEVRIESRHGAGTTVSLRVPIAAAVQRVLLVGAGGEIVAVPIGKVERIVEVEASAIERSGGDEFVLIDEEPTLVLDFTQRLGWQDGTSAARALGTHAVPLLLAEVRSERVALRVVRLSGQQDVYVKPPPALLAGVRSLIGLTVLGDGRPVFLVDLNQLR